MPGKFVFPGGRVDKADNRVPVAAPITKELEENLLKGSPKINAARAKSLAIAAIREACEETGLCLGRKAEGAAPKLDGAWKPFADAGPAARSVRSVPDRARDHPARPRPAFRYPLLHRGCLRHHPSRRGRDPSPTPSWSNWSGSRSAQSRWPICIRMTKNVLGELERRLATGPLRHDAAGAVLPFLWRPDAPGYSGRRETSLNWRIG